MTAFRALVSFVTVVSLSACASEAPGPADPSRAIHVVSEADLRACKPLAEGKKMAHVSVTFGESGKVVAALVDGGELLGTKAASCIEQELGKLRVPPFSGPSQRVARHVSLD